MNPLERLRAKRGRPQPALHEQAPPAPTVDEETGEILDVPRAEPAATQSSTGIAGDRRIPSVSRERTVRTLVTNALAFATFALLGLGVLAWYYSAQWSRARDAEAAAQKAADARTAGELKLPSLGRIDPPQPSKASTPPTPTSELLPPPPPLPAVAYTTTVASPPGPPPKSPEQLALERRLAAPVLYRPQLPDAGREAAEPRAMSTATGPTPAPSTTPLATLLRPTMTAAATAQLLPTRRLLLPKGAFIDCTLETAIDSTYDGMVTCIGASDVYGADGKVVLLERGTKYVGEKRGEVKQGQGRVFVLWNEARTPIGVVVQLASPGADELGRAGLPGAIDTHFWDRFGAAILISVIDGTVQALAASQQRGTTGTAVVLNPQLGRDVMTEVLKGTIAIPPTVVKNQGERIQVLVARDVDFRGVYALHGDEQQR
jgi:type IV secretion system protein VirB10